LKGTHTTRPHGHADVLATELLVGVVHRDGPWGSDVHGLLARRHHNGGGGCNRVSRRNHAVVVTVCLEEGDLLAQQTGAAARPEHEAGHEAADLVIDLVLPSESLREDTNTTRGEGRECSTFSRVALRTTHTRANAIICHNTEVLRL